MDETSAAPEVADEVLDRAVALLYERVLADDFLREYFWDVDVERLRGQQRAHLAAALGRAAPPSGRALEQSHRGLKISDFAFDCFLEAMTGALREAGLAAPLVERVQQVYLALKGRVVEDFKPDPKYAAFAGATRR